MLLDLLLIVFAFACLLSSAAACVSFVFAWTYFAKATAHFNRTEPLWWHELRTDPRAIWNPARMVLAVLRKAANGDDQEVRLYADRARMWGRCLAIAGAPATTSALILELLDLASPI